MAKNIRFSLNSHGFHKLSLTYAANFLTAAELIISLPLQPITKVPGVILGVTKTFSEFKVVYLYISSLF